MNKRSYLIFMYTIDELRNCIKAELDRQAYVEEPHSLFEPIKYIMADGGKRLRPVLALMAYNLTTSKRC